MASKNVPITVAHGDGIGPETMDATLHILKQAGAQIDVEPIEIGEKVYLRSVTAGIERFADAGLDFIKTGRLYTFDGRNGFSE